MIGDFDYQFFLEVLTGGLLSGLRQWLARSPACCLPCTS